jgi:hypothetical protein
MTETIDKILQKIEFNKEKNRIMVHTIKKQYYYDSIRQHRLSRNPINVTEEWHELSFLADKEPKKAVKLQILLKKSNVNTESLETMTGYFSQTLEAKILSDSIYQYQYLTIDKGRIWIHNLSSGQTTSLSLTGTQEGVSKEFLGTPKRLTNDEALKLMESGSPLFERVSEQEYRLLV